ncbi:hypothetical protein EVAR_56660_1 [Eumeta japonica]|uniref:Uncharacterized protein n=1 Tax=Eumeta variegata TaxID=151549 RepID=A0A4C2A088_EUMVA|nr:hypothetical protein EVAR_56660_1 [Eumeta japonica]
MYVFVPVLDESGSQNRFVIGPAHERSNERADALMQIPVQQEAVHCVQRAVDVIGAMYGAGNERPGAPPRGRTSRFAAFCFCWPLGIAQITCIMFLDQGYALHGPPRANA